MKIELGRPLAACLILAMLAGLAGLVLESALMDLWAAEEERDTKAGFVSPSVRNVAARRQPTGPDLFIAAPSETLAAARFDSVFRSIAADQGGSVLSSRAQAIHEDPDGPGRIEVEAEIEARNDDLQAILLRLESGAPAMLVERLSIEPAQGGAGPASDGAALSLHATLTLSGYWRPPSK